jgi:hypothetical protein
MIIDNQGVHDPIGFASLLQHPHLLGASVYVLGSWEHQLQILCKHLQAGTGISGGSDHDLRILHPCPLTFIIYVAGVTFTTGVTEFQGPL